MHAGLSQYSDVLYMSITSQVVFLLWFSDTPGVLAHSMMLMGHSLYVLILAPAQPDPHCLSVVHQILYNDHIFYSVFYLSPYAKQIIGCLLRLGQIMYGDPRIMQHLTTKINIFYFTNIPQYILHFSTGFPILLAQNSIAFSFTQDQLYN